MKVAFLRSYTLKKGGFYGNGHDRIWCNSTDAIVEEMRNKRVEVIDVIPDVEGSTPTVSKLRWIYEGYKKLIDIILEDNVDYVFVFHIFHHFPSEIRKMLFDLKSRVKVCGYTHGSH
jgi:hypothetical protein